MAESGCFGNLAMVQHVPAGAALCRQVIGTTVLVSEAVAGNSVPDVTPQLKADIDAKLKAVQVSIATGGVDAK